MTHPSKSFALVPVAGGGVSLRSLDHGETFHPVVGPMAEARELHVAQSRLRERDTQRLVVWDVGLGAAANALALIEDFSNAPGFSIELHSFDHTDAPLAFALQNADALGYLVPWREPVSALLVSHRATVGGITWIFHSGDFRDTLHAAPPPHAILYDPYSPAANPELWSLDHFTRLRAALVGGPGCTLTSYSRSTAVRVTLALAGFHVGRGTATGEKEETTVAATERPLLAALLGADWLPRVRRSTRSAPLGQPPGPICDADFARLETWVSLE